MCFVKNKNRIYIKLRKKKFAKLNNLSFLSTSSLHNVLENDIKRYQNVEKLIKGGTTNGKSQDD